MSKSVSPFKFVLAAALLVLALAGWYLTRPVIEQRPETKAPAQELPGETALNLGSAPQGEPKEAKPAPTNMVSTENLPAWERKIDDALRSNADTAVIAQMLLQQVPTMPPDGQTASARHIVNLIPDKDYPALMPFVQNTKLSEGFQEIIVAESLNRPDSVKLPVLLLAARTPQHPMGEIAKSTLAFLLEADHGSDWAKWEASVKQALEKQAAQQ